MRELFGGAVVADFPESYVDISHLHEVSNSQEVLNQGETDSSIIFDILEYADHIPNEQAARYYFEDNADLNACKSFEIDSFGVLPNGIQICFGKQTGVVKGKERDPEGNTIGLFLSVLRLPQARADLVVTLAFPLHLSPHNLTRGLAPKPTPQAEEEFTQLCHTLQVVDYGLFS
ncbi:hypothetical protein BASA81_007533 [Batrachochytrium salamandrivorans]|nr:hypothetical protein BASA81_007533 [Batrachochytrium salamandrivorans]